MEAGAMFSEWQFPFRDTNQSSCLQSNPPSAAAHHVLFCCQQAVYASPASAVAGFSDGKGHRLMQPFFFFWRTRHVAVLSVVLYNPSKT